MLRTDAILLAIALGACPKPTPDPTPPPPLTPPDAAVEVGLELDAASILPLDQDLPRLALRSVELYEEIARVFAATGPDCAGAATKLRAMQPAYADVVAANAAVLHTGGAKTLRAALEPHAARFDAVAGAIATSTTMKSCADDRELTDAFDALLAPP